MPSPIGHALGGLIVGKALAPSALLLCAIAGILPDIDFAWGGHNRQTHSIGAAVLAGLVVFAWKRSPRLAIAVSLAWSTHVLFDWLGSDDTPPLGVMALWPINSNFYFADAFVFEAISRRYWLDNFYTHNGWAVVKEVLILAPIVALVWKVRSSKRQVASSKK
ncbi:MAG TPA: metal-dependent hydrolase [Vicinamibacterales bacterium]|nr:metal-dependent hydrolase [Vicinamibacterales bacterium]